MKNKLLLSLCFSFLLHCFSHAQQSGNLKQLSWIEGNWKGMDGPKPFFEIYKIINDTTLKITSYDWDGKDSSKSSVTLLQRINGNYFLGDSLNWKVTNITDSSIYMEPVYKASNIILWKKRDLNSWDAILEFRNGRRGYRMERVKFF